MITTGRRNEAIAESRNRRQYSRANCSFKVYCITSEKKVFFSTATNISLGGVRIKTPVMFKPKSKLHLEIAYSNKGRNHFIKVVGEVRHTFLPVSSKLFDTGLKYLTKLDESDQNCINEFIENSLVAS